MTNYITGNRFGLLNIDLNETQSIGFFDTLIYSENFCQVCVYNSKEKIYDIKTCWVIDYRDEIIKIILKLIFSEEISDDEREFIDKAFAGVKAIKIKGDIIDMVKGWWDQP